MPEQKSPVRTVPALVLSLSVLAVLYFSAHRPLVILFHHGHGGILEPMILLFNILLGLVLAAVVNCLLDRPALRSYTVLLVTLFAAVFCLSGLLILAIRLSAMAWYSSVVPLRPATFG